MPADFSREPAHLEHLLARERGKVRLLGGVAFGLFLVCAAMFPSAYVSKDWRETAYAAISTAMSCNTTARELLASHKRCRATLAAQQGEVCSCEPLPAAFVHVVAPTVTQVGP